MVSDGKLRRIYHWVNLTFYGGELPDDVQLWWEPCGTDLAVTVLLDEVPGEHPQLGIKVDPCIAILRRFIKQTVAHECAHVKLWPERGLRDHGTRFDAEISRLCSHKSYRKLL